jgi:hypothetical protein
MQQPAQEQHEEDHPRGRPNPRGQGAKGAGAHPPREAPRKTRRHGKSVTSPGHAHEADQDARLTQEPRHAPWRLRLPCFLASTETNGVRQESTQIRFSSLRPHPIDVRPVRGPTGRRDARTVWIHAVALGALHCPASTQAAGAPEISGRLRRMAAISRGFQRPRRTATTPSASRQVNRQSGTRRARLGIATVEQSGQNVGVRCVVRPPGCERRRGDR